MAKFRGNYITTEEEREAQRSALLDTACAILVAEGSSALSVRRVSEATGVSTTAIYSRFGGKEGLLKELCAEGWARFEQSLRGVVDTDNPLADLYKIGLAYREFAIGNPSFYMLLFGGQMMEYMYGMKGVHEQITFRILVRAVQRCVDAGMVVIQNVEEACDVLWSLAHGMSSLEIAGFFSDKELAEKSYKRAITALMSPYLMPDLREAILKNADEEKRV